MPRARTSQNDRQTAASPQEQGSGCLSGFTIVPLSVILISYLLASLALKTNPAPSVNSEMPPAASTGISPIFTPEIQYWAGNIIQWAAASQLDPNLAATIMQIESCGDPRAKSSGAMGLFQSCRFTFYAADNPYDPILMPPAGWTIFSGRSMLAGEMPVLQWQVITAASVSSAAPSGPGPLKRKDIFNMAFPSIKMHAMDFP
jgi:hypothetical protein